MINEVATLSDVVAAYKDRGFDYVSTINSYAYFSGDLVTTEGTYACECYLQTDFSKPPEFYLKEIPDALKPVAPHIGASGYICYLASSTISLNIFDPVGQMIACLIRVSDVLCQILRGEVVADLVDEFFAFWGDGKYVCYLDVASEKSHDIVCVGQFLALNGIRAALFLSDDVGRTNYKATTLGFKLTAYNFAVERIKTSVAPMPSNVDWPIRNVEGLLAWQNSFDPATSKRIGAKIRAMMSRKRQAGIVLIESPLFSYGVLIFFDAKIINLLGFDNAKVYAKMPAVPLAGYRIDERYIASRNIPGMKTLSGKKIAIVGCGTIGGYLADLMVKAGAGTGGGKLTLVDYETLGTQNLGRHILGFSYVGKNKAAGLSHQLVKNNPDVSMRALRVDAREANLDGVDLIIDATADQALGNILAKKFGAITPLLTVWIEGPGVAVGAFLRPTSEHACAHCLQNHVHSGRYRTTVEDVPKIHAGQGCEQEYVPFPASVSLRAACLGAESVLDWVEGKVEPTLRTEVINKKFTSLTSAAVPERIEGCPACGI